MPALASLLVSASSGPLASLARVARVSLRVTTEFVGAVLARRQVNRLLELDDRMLKDIGLVRSDVTGALASPLSHDPSVWLRTRSAERQALRRSLQRQGRRPAPVMVADRKA